MLLAVSTEGQKPGGEIEHVRDLVLSLSKINKQTNKWRLCKPPVFGRALLFLLQWLVCLEDPPSVRQGPTRAWRMLTVFVSPLRTSIREAVSRGENEQGFQTFPVMRQRDTQGNLVRAHVQIPFKQPKELKPVCMFSIPAAPYTSSVRKHDCRGFASWGLEANGQSSPVRRGTTCCGNLNLRDNVKPQPK